jgi:hypothetical protein
VLARAFNDTASSVPLLPALRELHIDCDGAERLPAAACSGIASAGSRLVHLHLGGLSVRAAPLLEALVQLTGLTCLSLASLITPHAMSFGWLTALTVLRQLRYVRRSDDSATGGTLPCRLLARLSSIDALALSRCSFLNDPYLEEACLSMLRLRSLDLSGNAQLRAGLSALQRLTDLEVLGLAGVVADPAALSEVVRVPCSLRRCHLGYRYLYNLAKGPGGHRPAEQRVATSALLGGQVEAVFSAWGWERPMFCC